MSGSTVCTSTAPLLFSKLSTTRLHECDNCPDWQRGSSRTRETCEKIIADECSQRGLLEVTLISLCSGRLMQEVFIAKALIERGIAVRFILIDYIYFETHRGMDYFTKEPYQFDWNPNSARVYAKFVDDLLKDFTMALSELGGNASVLGVFSTVDNYLAAYEGTPAPMYEFVPNYDYMQATKYQRSDKMGIAYPSAKRRLEYWNAATQREMERYGENCQGVKPDLIVRVHGQDDDTINEIRNGIGEDAPVCLDFIPQGGFVQVIRFKPQAERESRNVKCVGVTKLKPS